jgi:hypothetical protein
MYYIKANAVNLVTAFSFHILYNSSFTDTAVIRRYITYELLTSSLKAKLPLCVVKYLASKMQWVVEIIAVHILKVGSRW